MVFSANLIYQGMIIARGSYRYDEAFNKVVSLNKDRIFSETVIEILTMADCYHSSGFHLSVFELLKFLASRF